MWEGEPAASTSLQQPVSEPQRSLLPRQGGTSARMYLPLPAGRWLESLVLMEFLFSKVHPPQAANLHRSSSFTRRLLLPRSRPGDEALQRLNVPPKPSDGRLRLGGGVRPHHRPGQLQDQGSRPGRPSGPGAPHRPRRCSGCLLLRIPCLHQADKVVSGSSFNSHPLFCSGGKAEAARASTT